MTWTLAAGLVAGCGGPGYRQTEGLVYGTVYHVTYEGEGMEGEDLARGMLREMRRVDSSLSMFNEESVIARWNRGGEGEMGEMEMDSLFARMWGTAVEVHEATGGAFDVTVAPLVNAWGFGFEEGRVPSAGEVDSLLGMVGMGKLRLEGRRLRRTVPGVMVDASAIAKGLGVDLVAEYLECEGVENYMVEIGGEVRVRGVNARGRAWRIGVDRPIEDSTGRRRELEAVFGLTGGALATSGNYRRYHVVDGVKYGHTIDPRTGRPVVNDLLSASVYARTCMEADAYATAFMVMGAAEAREVVERTPGLEACLIYVTPGGERVVWMSEGLRALKEE